MGLGPLFAGAVPSQVAGRKILTRTPVPDMILTARHGLSSIVSLVNQSTIDPMNAAEDQLAARGMPFAGAGGVRDAVRPAVLTR